MTYIMQGEMRNCVQISVGKSEQKNPLAIPMHRHESNIKMTLKDIECDGVDWIQLAQYNVKWWIVNTIINFQIPLKMAAEQL
jgi:hypothetical protein